MRREAPWKVPTAELYLMLRAGLVLPIEEFSEMLADYLAAVRQDDTRKPMDQARVVLTGSFCEQPPLGLIKTLERSGCYIVEDDLVQVYRWLCHDVPVDGDPLENLVRRFPGRWRSTVRRATSETMRRRARTLVQRVEESHAEGVLFCAPSFCDPALLDQPMATRAVEAAGNPVDRVQVLGEHRAVPGDSRASGDLLRLDQAVE